MILKEWYGNEADYFLGIVQDPLTSGCQTGNPQQSLIWEDTIVEDPELNMVMKCAMEGSRLKYRQVTGRCLLVRR